MERESEGRLAWKTESNLDGSATPKRIRFGKKGCVLRLHLYNGGYIYENCEKVPTSSQSECKGCSSSESLSTAGQEYTSFKIGPQRRVIIRVATRLGAPPRLGRGHALLFPAGLLLVLGLGD